MYGIEVAAGCGTACYDSEGDADGVGPADLEDGAEDGLGFVEEKGGGRGDAGVDWVAFVRVLVFKDLYENVP